MSKKDYLSQSTKKIYSESKKKEVYNELDDHIESKTDFFKDIDYSPDEAADKAVEAMSSNELIADEFGEIYSDYYSPLRDIIAFALHSAVLVGMFYLIKVILKDEPAFSPLIIGAMLLSVSISLFSGMTALKRKMLQTSVVSLFRLAGASVLNYYIVAEILKACHGRVDVLKTIITKSEICSLWDIFNRQTAIIITVIIAVICLVPVSFSIIRELKYRLQRLKSRDNTMRRFLIRIYRCFAFLLLAASLFFFVKIYIDYNAYKNEYFTAYNTVIKLGEEGLSSNEVKDFVEKSGYDFKEKTDNDGVVYEYIYSRNYTYFSIELFDEEKPEDIESYVTDEAEYGSFVKVLLYSDVKYFKKGDASFTVNNVINLDAASVDSFTSSIPYNHTDEETLEHYKKYTPKLVSVTFKEGKRDYRERLCQKCLNIIENMV